MNDEEYLKILKTNYDKIKKLQYDLAKFELLLVEMLKDNKQCEKFIPVVKNHLQGFIEEIIEIGMNLWQIVLEFEKMKGGE